MWTASRPRPFSSRSGCTTDVSAASTPILPAEAAPWLRGGVAVRVFACFAAGFALSYALRTINTVIAESLVTEFGLDNTQLGSLTAAYLLAFAAMQVPLGWCLDRFGPRRTQAALLMVAVAGCVVYAMADGFAMLWAGRALTGIGVAGCLISAFKGFRLWYPPQLQGRFAAWMMVAGTSGVMLSTAPAQWLVPAIGWRGLFWIFAVLLALSAAAYLALLPRGDRPTRPGGGGAASEGGYSRVFADPFFWRTCLYGVFHQGAFLAMQTLWIGPWLTRVLGMTPQVAANWLFLLNGFLLLAYLGTGWVAPLLERHGWSAPRVGSLANAVGVATLGAIVLSGGQGGPWPWLLLAAASAPNMLVQTHFNMSYPAARAGRASTAYNLAIFGGAFALQSALGAVIDGLRAAGLDDADAFRGAFGALWLAQAAALVGYMAWRGAHRP